MRIAVVGTGYVGLVTGTCLAEMGNNVTCIDINEEKIKNLDNGIIPIYEPGLEDLIKRNVSNGRLTFDVSLSKVINECDIVFSAVGTPPQEDGSADLKYVLAVAKEFGELIHKRTIFVTKSTVPVGTAKKVHNEIAKALSKRAKGADWCCEFDVVSNPEFLKEGTAVDDFLKPERIVVGTDNIHAMDVMSRLYSPFVVDNPNKLIFTDIASAEMIKYASNSMLATRISFMNEIANLCEKVGANVECVRKGMGIDSRIGGKFLYAGCGYGGSCFPKDVKALIKTGDENNAEMTILKAVDNANEKQKTILYKKLCKYVGSVNGLTIAVLGLAFKPETDDMREATSVVFINEVLKNGGKVRVYDPIAMETCKKIFGGNENNGNIVYCKDMYKTTEKSDALVLITEWKEFRSPDWDKIANNLRHKIVIDGRNIYNKEDLKDRGFFYEGFGR